MKTVPVLKRRQKGITDYGKRYKLLKSGQVRAVVRKSDSGLMIQFTEYIPESDHVIVTVTDKSVKKEYGVSGNNIQIFYLAGYLAGKKALAKGIDTAVMDTGRYIFIHGGRISAALKGMIDAGVNIPADESVFPDESRLNGEHLKNKIDLKKYIEKGA